MNKVKFGLLGCGLISQYAHLYALKKASTVELTAVCDVAEDVARQIATRFNVLTWFSDLDQFLDEADIEAVLIATPDHFHVSNAIECLRQGKHVLVEKPLALEMEECQKLARVVEETGLKLQVGNNKRFDPGIEFAHRFIQEQMGDRLSISGWYCDSAFRPAMQRALRLPLIRSTQQRGFDPVYKGNKKSYKLITHGIHLIDTLRHFGGEIVALEARFAAKHDNLTWHGVLEFEDGAVGSFELTTAVKMDWLEGFHVHGEGGSVEVKSFLPFYNRPSEVRAFDVKRNEYRAIIGPDSDPYERQLEAFANAIRNDTLPSPNLYDGTSDLAVVRTIEKSIEAGNRVVVDVPLQTGLVSG